MPQVRDHNTQYTLSEAGSRTWCVYTSRARPSTYPG